MYLCEVRHNEVPAYVCLGPDPLSETSATAANDGGVLIAIGHQCAVYVRTRGRVTRVLIIDTKTQGLLHRSQYSDTGNMKYGQIADTLSRYAPLLGATISVVPPETT